MGCETKQHKRVPCGLDMGFNMVPIWVSPTKYLAVALGFGADFLPPLYPSYLFLSDALLVFFLIFCASIHLFDPLSLHFLKYSQMFVEHCEFPSWSRWSLAVKCI